MSLRSSRLLAVRPTIDGVHLLSPAASPVGGDTIRIRLEVGPGAVLVVGSAAAAVARRGPDGSMSQQVVDAHVAPGGSLYWQVEPLVASHGCHHWSEVEVHMAANAHLWWLDTLVAGRADEPSGWCHSRLRVDVGGRPAIRHELTIGPETAARTPAVLGTSRVVATILAVGKPARRFSRPRTTHDGPAVATVLPLAVCGASLIEAFAPDHRSLLAALRGVGVTSSASGPNDAPVSLRGPRL